MKHISMDREEVNGYVARCKQLIEASPQMNEQNTKVRLVQPFLELLGWDFLTTEVELEYTIPMASGSTHVDYSLLVGDSPVVFVEAKPVRSTLTAENVQQLRSYMRQELYVDWGILTNGKSFEVLTKNYQQNGGQEVSVVQFNLDDLTENPDVLELLSKESIRSGRADEVAEQVAQTNEAIHHLQENEDRVTSSITESVENEVGDIPIDLEEQSREFVQNLVSVLREQRHFVGENGGQIDDTDTDGGEVDESEVEIDPKVNKISDTISRSELDGDSNAKVGVFPTRPSGLTFLKENEAWGFVRVGQELDYVAMYVSDTESEVRYIAEVKEIVETDKADLQRPPTEYFDEAKNADDKMVVVFEPGTLFELEDPIPFETKYPQALRYTTFGSIKQAKTTNDLF